MLQEFNPTLLHGDDLMELGMGELKVVFKKKSKKNVYLLSAFIAYRPSLADTYHSNVMADNKI